MSFPSFLYTKNSSAPLLRISCSVASGSSRSVMINLIHDFNLDPKWGVLGSDDPEHLRKVRALLEKHHMYAESSWA